MKPINEPMDPYQLSVILNGGNSKFATFFQPYQFTVRESAIKLLYKTDCAHYYRKMIRAHAQGKEYNVTKPAKSFGEGIDAGGKVVGKIFSDM